MIANTNPGRLTVDRKIEAAEVSDLVTRCLAGDRRAWDRIIDQYGRLVYSIPRRYGIDEADADDVFQNVFLTLYRKLDTLRDHERLSSWLITTTHRECWRVGKRSPKAAEYDLDTRLADVAEPSPEEASRWEQQQLVRDAMDELGGPCATLLRALFLDAGPPNYEAVAGQLGMKVGSIGPTRARCFRKLERILRAKGIEAPLTAGTSTP